MLHGVVSGTLHSPHRTPHSFVLSPFPLPVPLSRVILASPYRRSSYNRSRLSSILLFFSMPCLSSPHSPTVEAAFPSRSPALSRTTNNFASASSLSRIAPQPRLSLVFHFAGFVHSVDPPRSHSQRGVDWPTEGPSTPAYKQDRVRSRFQTTSLAVARAIEHRAS